jgi:hypothetical protein
MAPMVPDGDKMTTSQLLTRIKPRDGGSWTPATHAWFQGMLSSMKDGAILMVPVAGECVKKVGNGWQIL